MLHLSATFNQIYLQAENPAFKNFPINFLIQIWINTNA